MKTGSTFVAALRAPAGAGFGPGDRLPLDVPGDIDNGPGDDTAPPQDFGFCRRIGNEITVPSGAPVLFLAPRRAA